VSARPLLTPSTPRAAWLILACALALPATVWAASPAAVYPPLTDGLTRDEEGDVEAVVVSGLHQAARGMDLVVRDPAVLKPTCGRAPKDECLAGLAADGFVVVARARREGVHVVVSVALVNGHRKRTRWSAFLTTLTVQDARPCAQAIWLLESELSRSGTSPPPLASTGPARGGEASAPPAGSRSAPSGAAAAGGAATQPGQPDLAAHPSAAAVATVAPSGPARSGGWSRGRSAGAWTAAGGLALVAAGGLAAWKASGIERTLTDRFTAGTLTPSDAPSYDSGRRWNQGANLLFLAGGLVTAGGTAIFLLSPAVEPAAGGGVTLGLAGRF